MPSYGKGAFSRNLICSENITFAIARLINTFKVVPKLTKDHSYAYVL